MKFGILTLLMLMNFIGKITAQQLVTLYTSSSTTFQFNSDGGQKSEIKSQENTTWPLFNVYKEFIRVEDSTGRRTEFKINHIEHKPNTKYWNFAVSREGIRYEVHLNVGKHYILFISQDPDVPYLSTRDLFVIDPMTNWTNNPDWGV